MEIEKKLISVIIPCYNVSQYIDRCMESLVNQTIGIENLLCILVDDASSDHTLDKLKEWEERYPDSVIVIACRENGKQGRARNIGLEYANSEYIGFVDSDDYISPEMYEVLYETAQREGVDVVECLGQREFQDGKIAQSDFEFNQANKRINLKEVEDKKRAFEYGWASGLWAKLYRNIPRLFEGLYFPEQLAYEDNFWMAMMWYRMESYYLLDKVYYHYMVNYNSTIMQRDSDRHLDRLVIELMKVEEFKRLGLFETYHDEIEKEFLGLFFINSLKIFFVRFSQIPYDLIRSMQENVMDLFPDFEKNKYYDSFNPLQKQFLTMVRLKLTNEQIDILAREYVNLVRESEQ